MATISMESTGKAAMAQFSTMSPLASRNGVAFPFNPSMGRKKHSERGMVIGLKLLLISEQVCNLISNKIICFPEI